MPKITLEEWPLPLIAKTGTILDAALSAGVPFPHGCRSGDCGSCKARLLSGQVIMDGYAREALTDTEREEGLILACCARPADDVEIAWLPTATDDVSYPIRRVRAIVSEKEAATHDITRLRLSIKGPPLAFAAGQFAQLTFRGLPSRPYSMANNPAESELEFHIRRIPNGKVSSYVAERLKLGESLTLLGPYGTACLRNNGVSPLLLVAGGSGLAPMKSILLKALTLTNMRPVQLYHGVRDTHDLYESDLLARLVENPRFRFTPVLSMPTQESGYRTGFVHEAIATDYTTLAGVDVYLAGPPPMVDATTEVALRLGAERENVYGDPFYAAPEESPRAKRWSGAVQSVFDKLRQSL